MPGSPKQEPGVLADTVRNPTPTNWDADTEEEESEFEDEDYEEGVQDTDNSELQGTDVSEGNKEEEADSEWIIFLFLFPQQSAFAQDQKIPERA